ncbi:MAG: ROK family protein, partial [Candidatus Margulisiibacteriota bacterium]
DVEKITTKHLAEAVNLGDTFALGILEKAAYHIALGLNNYIHLLDPELIIIGGGLSNFGELFFRFIKQHLRDIHRNEGVALPDVVPSPLGQDSGVVGAVALAVTGGL